MNTKQRKTLELLFRTPPPTQIPWDDILSLFQALEATIRQRAGSRVAISLNGIVAVFHEPHPERKARRLLIRDVRNFLQDAGVKL
ncbi:MAG: hexulose-6-phosphate synthase [Thermomicrobia bacterium]|nr:hexulose-6-phosphate synthase [Thermomicrobia bacterium]MCA1725384.1 hexulose-6-phosphate synthase [Thermomicrobia bacterium]